MIEATRGLIRSFVAIENHLQFKPFDEILCQGYSKPNCFIPSIIGAPFVCPNYFLNYLEELL